MTGRTTGDGAGQVTGLPLDRLLALYLLVAGAALAFPHRPASWPWLLAAHAIGCALFWPLPAVARAWRAARPALHRAARTAADWTPLLLVPALYTELAVLNSAVHGGAYFDAVVIGWEQLLFDGQPSRAWAAAAPWLWLSEPLHFSYLSYYFIVLVPAVLLFMRGRTEEFRAGVFTLMLSFFVHYLFFIYFPVQGPRYLFPAPAGELSSGYFYQLAHRVLEAGSAQGAAFPSSHVGVSVTQTLIVLRFMPRLAPVFGLLTLGLALGAVYGGFHYAIDTIAGAALGTLAYFLGIRFYGTLRARTVSSPDPAPRPHE